MSKPLPQPAADDIRVAIAAINNYQIQEEERGALDADSETYIAMDAVITWLHSLLTDT